MRPNRNMQMVCAFVSSFNVYMYHMFMLFHLFLIVCLVSLLLV